MKYEGKIYGKVAGRYIELHNGKSEDDLAKALQVLSDLCDLQNGPPLETYRERWEETMSEAEKILNQKQ